MNTACLLHLFGGLGENNQDGVIGTTFGSDRTGRVGTALLLVLIVFPAVFSLWRERSLSQK